MWHPSDYADICKLANNVTSLLIVALVSTGQNKQEAVKKIEVFVVLA